MKSLFRHLYCSLWWPRRVIAFNKQTCLPGEFTTPRAILTGHDCEVTCASVCAELGLVISGCKGATRPIYAWQLIASPKASGLFRLTDLSVCSEGPCLIHSMNGDLLRTLEAPEDCLRPRLIQSSTEGNCIIYYDKGHFCLFSVNGKLLGHMEVEDSIKVREPCTHARAHTLARTHARTRVQRCSRTRMSAPVAD